MEAVIDMPYLELPRFVDAVNSVTGATGRTLAAAWNKLRNGCKQKNAEARSRCHIRHTAHSKEKLHKVFAKCFATLDEFMDFVPEILAHLHNEHQNAAQLQVSLTYCTGLRKVLLLLEDLLLTIKDKRGRWLNSEQYERLKKIRKHLAIYVDMADLMVFRTAKAPTVLPKLKNNIGSVELAAPLRIFVEDDDTGKHISCLEFPMLYGFGETESEALEMLDREIVSLCEDAEAFPDLPDEYRYAAILAKMAVKNAKQ